MTAPSKPTRSVRVAEHFAPPAALTTDDVARINQEAAVAREKADRATSGMERVTSRHDCPFCGSSSRPTAIRIKKMDGWQGDAALYRTEGGSLPEYVVVSAACVMGLPETYIFEADAGGDVVNWSELPESRKGMYDREGLLESLGYQIHSPVGS